MGRSPVFPGARRLQALAAFLVSKRTGTTGSRRRDLAIKFARLHQRNRWLVSPRRLGVTVDSVPVRGPIFLLGLPGNGATLIGRCLRQSDRVVTVSGNSRSWTGADEMAIIWSRVRRLPTCLRGNLHRRDVRHPLFGESQLFAYGSLLAHYRGTAADASPEAARSFKRLLREHIAVYAHDPATARFLDKSHAHTVRIPLLATLLADAEPFFLLVVRNPYFMVPWTLRRKRPGFRQPLGAARELEIVARNWTRAYGVALEDAAAANVAVLRFEDFLRSPRPVVADICEFVGLGYEPKMTPESGSPMPWATLPSDRKWFPLYGTESPPPLTHVEAAIVERCCGSLAACFGYTSEGTTEPAPGVELLGRRSEGLERRAAAGRRG